MLSVTNCNICHFSDYRHIPELDVYDQDNLDDSEYSMISEGDRAAAEGAMRKRDRDEGLVTGRMRRGLLYGKLDSVVDDTLFEIFVALIMMGALFSDTSFLWSLSDSNFDWSDESDDEEERPARKRRMAERAAEGDVAEDEEVIALWSYKIDLN